LSVGRIKQRHQTIIDADSIDAFKAALPRIAPGSLKPSRAGEVSRGQTARSSAISDRCPASLGFTVRNRPDFAMHRTGPYRLPKGHASRHLFIQTRLDRMNQQFGPLLYMFSIWALPTIVAITFHEAAHGFSARLFGDDTAWRLGRVTFNPLRHIDPIGTI